MCDFFWLSPADQGDLSDVVRASLPPPPPPPQQQHHHHRLLAAATSASPTACSLGSHHLPEEDGLLLLRAGRANFDGDDHDEARSQRHQQHQVNDNGSMGLMLGGSNGSSGGCACDHAAALGPQHHPEAEGLIPRPPMSGPQPQSLCASSFVERDDDAPVLLEEHVLDMAMAAPHHPHTSAVKRRKSQTKKMVCIPAPVAAPPGVAGRPSTSGEVVPSDLWAWRKYGQKPIKGSPYPRGYYRCSSSKGCSARKQVERSRTDPSMLVITYTSDHNHPWPTQRNALAGSTRPAFSSSSSSSARSHHHRHHSAAAVPDTTPAHRHASNVAVADNATPGPGSIISASGIHHQLLKQEVVDMDNASSKQPAQDAADDHDCLGMFADMDGALDVLCASDDFHPKRQQQQATAQHLEKLPEEEDKQLLLLGPDPFSFSFSFLEWVGDSFGVGETAPDNGDHS